MLCLAHIPGDIEAGIWQIHCTAQRDSITSSNGPDHGWQKPLISCWESSVFEQQRFAGLQLHRHCKKLDKHLSRLCMLLLHVRPIFSVRGLLHHARLSCERTACHCIVGERDLAAWHPFNRPEHTRT